MNSDIIIHRFELHIVSESQRPKVKTMVRDQWVTGEIRQPPMFGKERHQEYFIVPSFCAEGTLFSPFKPKRSGDSFGEVSVE